MLTEVSLPILFDCTPLESTICWFFILMFIVLWLQNGCCSSSITSIVNEGRLRMEKNEQLCFSSRNKMYFSVISQHTSPYDVIVKKEVTRLQPITERPRNEVSEYSVLVLGCRKIESRSEWFLKVIVSVSYIHDVKGFIASNQTFLFCPSPFQIICNQYFRHYIYVTIFFYVKFHICEV